LANSKVPDVNFYLGIICSLYVVTRKMCELYLCETKSGETLMEVYRNTDVQIVCQIWV